jgi:GNAT superfamily N-acetyltransferase
MLSADAWRMSRAVIERLDAPGLLAELPALCALLEDCVEGGASIGFLWPMAEGEAEAYWRGVARPLAEATCLLLVVRDETGAMLGSGQLDLATRANGLHRAEISKLMVLRSVRRRGIGRALLQALETEARRNGRSTLVLDTRLGDPSEGLYRSAGWTLTGIVPRYARSSDGNLDASAFYHKLLDGED